jgi:hypothetical protein
MTKILPPRRAILPVLLAALPFAAHAQSQSDTPPADPGGIVTIQIENDAFSIPGTDRYYTSGERLGYVTPTGDVPGFVANFGQTVFGPGTQRLEFDLQQTIFTPRDTQAYDPDPHDLPYSGDLALHTSLIQDSATTRSIAGVSVGVVGPAALGQSVQNGFHYIIGDTSNKGWHDQLHNEPTLDFSGGRIWRYDLASLGGGALAVQALPQASAQLGNTEIYAQAGAILRIGAGLDSDFGPAVIQPQMSGTDAYTPTQPFVWYVFGGAVGRVVGHELAVQGNDFQSSRGVALTPLQGDLEVGGAVIIYGIRLTATEVFETAEFHGEAPAFQYGSIALSARF